MAMARARVLQYLLVLLAVAILNVKTSCLAQTAPTTTANADVAGQPPPDIAEDLDRLKKAEQLYAIAWSYEAIGDIDHAAKVYQSLLGKFPKHPQALYQLGVCYQRQAKPADALSTFERFVTNGLGPKELLDQAKARMQSLTWPLHEDDQRAFDTAVSYLQFGDALSDQAVGDNSSELAQRVFRQAIQRLEGLLNKTPKYVPAYLYLALAQGDLFHPFDAYDASERFLEGCQQKHLQLTDEQERRSRPVRASCAAILNVPTKQYIRCYDRKSYCLVHRSPDKARLENFDLNRADFEKNLSAAWLKVVPGLADPKATFLISIEDADRGDQPPHYLQVPGHGDALVFDIADNDAATFEVHDGLAAPGTGWVSFQLYGHPNRFIVQDGETLTVRALGANDSAFPQATFRLLGYSFPNVPPVAKLAGVESDTNAAALKDGKHNVLVPPSKLSPPKGGPLARKLWLEPLFVESTDGTGGVLLTANGSAWGTRTGKDTISKGWTEVKGLDQDVEASGNPVYVAATIGGVQASQARFRLLFDESQLSETWVDHPLSVQNNPGGRPLPIANLQTVHLEGIKSNVVPGRHRIHVQVLLGGEALRLSTSISSRTLIAFELSPSSKQAMQPQTAHSAGSSPEEVDRGNK
jgi:tetratricopeptide (TPR) repeat protein